MIVSNSTPIIGLAKIGRLGLLRELFGVIYIPVEVKIETVDKGIAIKAPDAHIIREAIDGKWMVVEEVLVPANFDDFGIDRGEAAALALAKKKGSKNVLIDERHARLAAKAIGLRPLGTIYVLLSGLEKKIITYEEYSNCLEELIRVNFRLSEEVYIEALKKGKEIRDKKK